MFSLSLKSICFDPPKSELNKLTDTEDHQNESSQQFVCKLYTN